MTEKAVLLVDWDNLAGAILGRGSRVVREQVHQLWAWANQQSGYQLKYAHLAATHFDHTIKAVMAQHGIKEESVRSTKEQADILLTVLAMDYLHQGVEQFFLVTGDQDFIPLISRLNQDNRKVTVVYGDPARLSVELRNTLANTGAEAVDIADVVDFTGPPGDHGARGVLGLLELQRRGFILGGQETGKRAGLLAGWGVLPNAEHNEYWSLTGVLTEKVQRLDAAVKGPDNTWLPKSAQRTCLRIDDAVWADIVAADHLVRLLAGRPQGVSYTALRSGPLATDDGSALDRVVDALLSIGLARRGADDRFTPGLEGLQLGYLEPLWRVYACVSEECFHRGRNGIPHERVENSLVKGGLGQGREARSRHRVGEALKYAKSAGVIDTVAVQGKRQVITPVSGLTRPFERGYRELYRLLGTERTRSTTEVLAVLEERDQGLATPLFGYGNRDRHRLLRILHQSRLLVWHNDTVRVNFSKWG
ncbi:hypothetical protein JOF53_001126 [Crossiella equi]|uniref:NYN domain-containing protein n=1 Tax=Crossiella equi TaxID=130796 RepID=A0ABS5A7P9_9PSEU|nr:NYN domain-containing protein [Crossiella equi]MBP2472254.1 hypothetical protein [Crossiella equi]